MPYIGVHALCLYAGLGITALFSYPTYALYWYGKTAKQRHVFSEQCLSTASFIATLGSIIKLFAYLNRTENGVFACYATGQVLISIAIALKLTIALLVLKHLYKDTFALLDTFGATCLGLVLATFVTHIVYNDTDKFFTKIEQVQTKTFIINLA